jgi:hypothetical protein
MNELWPSGPYDILMKDLVVVFCGLNPSVEAAATGHNFGSASNRFWRVLHLAGFTSHRIEAKDGRDILHFGCGVTAAVGRGTRSAADVPRSEFAREAPGFELPAGRHRLPRKACLFGDQRSAIPELGAAGGRVCQRGRPDSPESIRPQPRLRSRRFGRALRSTTHRVRR